MISDSELLKLIQSCISDFLKPLGFKKKNLTWRSKSSETISLFNVQRSNWGQQFYFNIGAYVPNVEDQALDNPSVADLHFWWRLESLAKLNEQFGMPLTISPPQEDVASALLLLNEAMQSKAVPILKAMRTVNGIWQVKQDYPDFVVKSPLVCVPPFAAKHT